MFRDLDIFFWNSVADLAGDDFVRLARAEGGLLAVREGVQGSQLRWLPYYKENTMQLYARDFYGHLQEEDRVKLFTDEQLQRVAKALKSMLTYKLHEEDNEVEISTDWEGRG